MQILYCLLIVIAIMCCTKKAYVGVSAHTTASGVMFHVRKEGRQFSTAQ